MKKRLVIDINSAVPFFATGNMRGIGRTTIELVAALDARRDALPFEVMLYTQNLRGIGGREMNTGFRYRNLYMRNHPKWTKWVNRLHMRELLTNYDMLHIPHNFEYVVHPEKTILTIHDVMFFSYPEPFGIDHYRKMLPPLARKSPAIITISECSKREIIQYMDVSPDRVHVIPWGVNHDLLYPHTPQPNKLSGKNPYFFMVAGGSERKNVPTVLKAFELFSSNVPGHHLIIVGYKPSEKIRKQISGSHMDSRVHFASNLSNEQLADLYAGASCSFFPSLYEGFGLPIVESMACGVPVVTCRNSSLEEVGGDAALYVEPFDYYAMARIMEEFENGNVDLDALRPKLIARASKFSWDNCCDRTIEVYRNVLGV